MQTPKKAYILLAVLFLGIMISSYSTWGRSGLLWGFILSLMAHWLIFFYGDSRLLRLFPMTELEGKDAWGVLETVQRLSKKARIPAPSVFLVESKILNSYSVAKHRKKSAIILTTELMKVLSKEELEGLLAHEVAGIRRLETVNFSVTSVIMAPFLLIADLVRPGENSPKIQKYIHSVLLHLFGPFMALIRFLVVSRKTYHLVDSEAVELTNKPMPYAQMLWKLQSYASTNNVDLSPSTAHLFVVNPLTANGWGRYFQAQPPLEQRIRRLVGYYPI